MRHFFWILLYLSASVAALAQQRGEVRATVYPQMPNAGQSAQYVIHFTNVDGLDNLQIEPPMVAGLQFNPTPLRQQSVQSINFQTTREVRLAWNFVARGEGVFEIPPRELQIGNQTFTIPAVQFRVAPPDETLREAFFLELELPDRPLFPGERLLVPLHLYARTDFPARLLSMPERRGDAFLQEELNQQFQSTRIRRNGMEYNRATWMLVLSPLRSGEHPLSFQISIAYENPRTPRSRDIFGFSQARVEEMLLSTREYAIQVQEFPREGRPVAFRGAIGDFQLSSKLDSTELQVGEPVTLTVVISGSGNIESIQPPVLQDASQWRQYPPRVRTERSDPLQATGSRIFEYILLPEDEAITSAPGVHFAYFHAESHSWRELQSGGQAVTVQAAPTANVGHWDFTRQNRHGMASASGGRSLAGPVSHPGTFITWQSVHRAVHPTYWLALPAGGSIALALLALALWTRRRNQENAALKQLEQTRKLCAVKLEAAATAHAAGNAAAYWKCVHAAVQSAIARLDRKQIRQPASLTSEDMQSILRKYLTEACQSRSPGWMDSPEQEALLAQLQAINNACEQAEYSGTAATLHKDTLAASEAKTFVHTLLQLP